MDDSLTFPQSHQKLRQLIAGIPENVVQELETAGLPIHRFGSRDGQRGGRGGQRNGERREYQQRRQ